MKLLFASLLCLFASVAIGQKIALLSTDFKKPIIYTDSVTVEQINSGYFPVEVKNFDTLYANLKYLREMLKERSRSKMESFDLKAGSTVLNTAKSPRAYGDHYDVVAKSTFGEVGSSFILTPTKTNKKNSDKINDMMNYITKNRALFKEIYEIHPKIYNVVIVRE